MGRQVFVDGYNVIHADRQLAALARRSLELARNTLIALLAADPKLRFDDITVVFDGADVPGGRALYTARGRVRVRFSRPGESADELIRRLVEAAGSDGVLVISNDRDVRSAATFTGGRALGIRPTPPPRAQRRAPPRPEDDDDEAPRPTFGRKRGNPQRAPRRARQRDRDRYWR